jgi:hypothetical protein
MTDLLRVILLAFSSPLGTALLVLAFIAALVFWAMVNRALHGQLIPR